MGACAIASMVLTQSPVSVLANEFDTVYQTETNEATNPIQQAITNANDGDVIQIQGENTENITIPENKKITLEFAKGASLKNSGKNHTITVKKGATLKIAGAGTITNDSHQRAALVNENGGTVILDDGITVARYKDVYDEKNENNPNNNSFYTVMNQGTMTIKKATISNAGDFSSCVENGWAKVGDIPKDKTEVKLTIEDGAYISGGINSVKNVECGVLKVTGGTIVSNHQYAIMNWNKAEITGGVIENEKGAAIHNGNEVATSAGEMTISGTAVVKGDVAVFIRNNANDTSKQSKLTIEGGTLLGKTKSIYAKANTTTTISGGEIKGSLNLEGSPSVTVTGGKFTKPLPEGVKQDGDKAHFHDIREVSKAPTCTEPGVESHFECITCHDIYSDKDGNNPLDKTTKIPATGHTYTWVIDKEPTKDHAGSKYQYCVVCHHKKDPVSIPAIGYTEKVESAVYRAYNPNNGEHLYTANYDEFRTITNIGWHDEGIAFMTESAKEGLPLYRVYNPNSGLHHYTIDENEKNTLVSLGWKDEDVTMYTSAKPQCAAVFRVYNPNGGQHHYTKDANEKNVLVSLGWHDEGIAFRTAEIPTK